MNNNDNKLAKFTSSGTLTLYTDAGLSSPYWVTLDGAGSPWITNLNSSTVSAFTSAGTAVTPSTGYTIPSVNGGFATSAIDGSGNLWLTETSRSQVTEIVGVAVPVVTPITPASLAQRP